MERTEHHIETPIREAFDKLSEMTPIGFHVGARVRFGRASLLYSRYPREWLDRYVRANRYVVDPTVIWGIANTGSRRWSELKFDPQGLMAEAASYGLRYGFTAAIGPLSSKSIFGMAHDEREFTDAEIARAVETMTLVHDIVGRRKPLLDTHLRALELMASGYDATEMAARLKITPRELKSRLSGARKRLGARSNAEALAIARGRNILHPHTLTENPM